MQRDIESNSTQPSQSAPTAWDTLRGQLMTASPGWIAAAVLVVGAALAVIIAGLADPIARQIVPGIETHAMPVHWGVFVCVSALFAMLAAATCIALPRIQRAAVDREAKARQLRERLDGILVGSEEGFWDWHIQTGERWFSERVYQILGEPDIGQNANPIDWRSRLHPEDLPTFDAAMECRLSTGEQSIVEYRLCHASGADCWIRDRGGVVSRSETGEPLRMSGSFIDITQERRQRIGSDLNRELLQRAEAIARIGGWKLDLVNDELFWTDQTYRIHEVPMTYRPDVSRAIEFYERSSRPAIIKAIEMAREKGESFDLELAFRTAKGRRLWVRAIGEPIYEGSQIVGLHGTFQDISERKRSEMALLQSEQRYKLAVESAADGIWEWDIVLGKMTLDPLCCQILGYPPAEAATSLETWTKLIHPDDVANFTAVFQAYLDNKTPHFDSRHRMRAHGGEWKWIQTRGKIVARSATGQPLHMTGTHKDISFDKEVEEQLRAAYRAAQEATRAKTEFLANMSHEIRTPMTAILGFSENLQRDDLNEQERRNAITTIRRNGEHLLTVINDILDLSKIEAGKVSVEKIKCSPTRIACETIDLLKLRADAKGLALKAEIVGEVPTEIETDPTRLRQILVNIIGNAIKFTELGGVRVVIRFVPDDANPKLRFDVIDTGIGMDKTEMSRLFRAFSQADSTMSRRFGGTGLGLVISRRFAELMGGTLTAESEPGRGSRFSVTISTGDVSNAVFTRDVPNVDEDVHIERPKDADGNRLEARILVAEDGPDNQRLISMLLRKIGATAVIAGNGHEAVQMYKSTCDTTQAFDLVLMDMQMPVLDGYEATRLLRARGCQLPIIALTAHTMRGDREKCMNAGCTDYLTKPIRRAELFQCIREHLGVKPPSGVQI